MGQFLHDINIGDPVFFFSKIQTVLRQKFKNRAYLEKKTKTRFSTKIMQYAMQLLNHAISIDRLSVITYHGHMLEFRLIKICILEVGLLRAGSLRCKA